MTEPTDAELDELRQGKQRRLNFVTLSEFRQSPAQSNDHSRFRRRKKRWRPRKLHGLADGARTDIGTDQEPFCVQRQRVLRHVSHPAIPPGAGRASAAEAGACLSTG